MSKLFYIVGPSGAGKDSLIEYCREQLNGVLPIIFTHRYITHPATTGAANSPQTMEQSPPPPVNC